MTKTNAQTNMSPLNKVVSTLNVNGAAKALDLYKKAFGAEELSRMEAPDGSGKIVHAVFSINGTTLFIYPATAAKQKEYQDLQVRTFQVNNIDVKYMMSVLKSVVKVKEISADEKTGTLVIRDTPDAVAVAAKVIAAHDVPEPEVMLEVEVMEISHDRLTNLGLQLPDSISIS